MSNFWDILHCMDFQELFLEWGVTEVQMTHMSQPLMTQQWLSSSNGWGHPQRVRNGQKPCEQKEAATAQKMGCYQTRWAKLIQLILGQESPFPPAFHWVLVILHSRCCQKSSTFFATNAPVTTSPGQTSCLELGVFAAQIIEPCCVTVNLLATSQKNGGLPICFSRGWCRTIIGCDRLQGDAVGELNNFITILVEKRTKITSALCFHVLVRLDVPGIVFVFRLAVLFCSWKIGVVRKRLLPTPLWMFPATFWNQHYIS